MIKIGPYTSPNRLILAPMAGITDQPFRVLCRQFGAGLTPSEMVWSQGHLYKTKKTQNRITHNGEPEPIIVQIAGGDPEMLKQAALLNIKEGAQIIDINMGCPAKKVCNKLAGSALMQDESLVADILSTVVSSVNVPVTLKIRTGWNTDNKNALKIAKIAENSGIQLLSIHGRTRCQKYTGSAEYDTISEIKQSISIPVIANGDIDSEQKAKYVLDYTKADGIMIGRAAQGKPWIFEQIQYFLEHNQYLDEPTNEQKYALMKQHLYNLHQFYGDYMGIRIARKHIGWYLETITNQLQAKQFKRQFNCLESTHSQFTALASFFNQLNNNPIQYKASI
ncbi:tRNA dihydrouridine synthase DusB [Thiotrichales bacterium 19S3-7]|nr:tRNA dihydrouridine synthase DusB [Thiotrichales bacterium 19S3-7]MCF6801497.1 tRNA dihydrouridine synthase DusB [Thiotrichales bacterium 19S3-11]